MRPKESESRLHNLYSHHAIGLVAVLATTLFPISLSFKVLLGERIVQLIEMLAAPALSALPSSPHVHTGVGQIRPPLLNLCTSSPFTAMPSSSRLTLFAEVPY